MAVLVLFFVLFFLLNSTNVVADTAGDGSGESGMVSDELAALSDVVGSLLSDPSWAEYHPHPCTDTPWPGIQCELVQGQEQQLHVTRLHIGPDIATPPCKASAKLSKSILKLPYLKTLSLFNCFLSPTDSITLPPSLFTNSSSLEQLVINSNPGLTGQIPSTIGNLEDLRVLSLSQNNIHGAIPKELCSLGKLEQLDLSYNHLTGHIPNEINGLTSLGVLDLCSNKLEGEITSSVGELRSLQKLDLSNNNLSGNIPSEVGKMNKLVLLDLSYNSLTGPIPGTLSGLKELQYFMIERNPIGSTLPVFVGELSKLAVLGFSSCDISGPIPTFIGSLLNLTALSLDRNKLNGSIPPSLGSLPKLGQLNLSQNQLTGEITFSDEFVNRLGKRLDVRDNKGLCKDPLKYSNPSLYLEVPPCLGTATANQSSNRSGLQESGADGDGKSVERDGSDSKPIIGPNGIHRVMLYLVSFLTLMLLY